MTLPPLYKYLDVQGAKLTLGNGTFKHSKPSEFNDLEDMTIQSLFPEDVEVVLEEMVEELPNLLFQNSNDQPSSSSPMKGQVEILQKVFKDNPKALEIVEEELRRQGVGSIYDIDHMRGISENFIQKINSFMQGYRLFCATTHQNSEHMWSKYAESHQGIVLRIEPNIERNSKFQLFRQVEYHKERPSLYNNTLDFLSDALFGDRDAVIKAIIEKIVYSKTLKWQSEGEYRLAIALGKGEASWDIQPYYPEEITELYLGHAMEDKNKTEIMYMAKSLNPDIKIFG